MTTITATYSPDDNKLRLYASTRLDRETYDRVRAAGFIWAPKQELFVAPMWTPSREDLARELAGEIDDEDVSLRDRAEERAERFEDYHESRTADANAAHRAVAAIADNIPLGQPILVGHHSERHARKDRERIENGMRLAVRAWETAAYWKGRAAGAIANAKYKERPDVRARRIKTIAAEQRKHEREKKEAETMLAMWLSLEKMDNDPAAQLEQARLIAGRTEAGRLSVVRKENDPNWFWHAYDVLQPAVKRSKDCPPKTVAEVIARARATYPARMAWSDRWIAHCANRIEYERAMLGETGGLAAERFDIQPGGRVLIGREWLAVLRVNRKDGKILSVRTNGRFVPVRGAEEIQDYEAPSAEDATKAKAATKLAPMVNYPGDDFLELTAAEWKRRPADYKGTRFAAATAAHGAYRYRTTFKPGGAFRLAQVFITDAKRIDPPPPNSTPPEPVTFDRRIEPPAPPIEPPAPRPADPAPAASEPSAPDPAAFEAMKASLRAGITVAVIPQLFPTPPDLAARMVALAEIKPHHRVLEPSAGTGNLIRAIGPTPDKVAIETDPRLCRQIRESGLHVIEADFLQFDPPTADPASMFDRVVMNPPFQNGADIRHIKHAARFLRPGGRLVALCADGPRQREMLRPLASQWHELPEGSFSEQGTGVRVAMLVIDRPAPVHTKIPGLPLFA